MNRQYPLRILLVSLGIYSREGGMERFYRRLLRSLADLRGSDFVEDVSVLSLWDSPDQVNGVPKGVNYFCCRSNKVTALSLFFSLAVKSQEPLMIVYGHILLTPLAIFGRIISRRFKQVLIVHGTEVWGKPSTINKLAAKYAIDYIFSVSDFTARRMQIIYGLAENKFRLLPCAVDATPAESSEIFATSPGLMGRWRLLTVSRLDDRYKNIDKVILALPNILSSFPDIHYYVVGEGIWRPELEQVANSIGVAGHVHFLGWVPDEIRDAVYKQSHIFILPSTGEGFGIVFLEAWRHGLPVVASNLDAATEIVKHGVDGFCIDPNPEKIAEVICQLFSSPERRHEMGVEGYQHLLECYSHLSFSGTLKKLLEEVSGNDVLGANSSVEIKD